MLGGNSTLLDLDALRTFVAINELRSFAKAAGKIGRSPAAVSMQIKRLERDLGAPLFERTSRKIMLSSHGERLLSYAWRLLALSNEAAAEFITPNIEGTVRLGIPNDFAETNLPIWLKRIRDHYPAVAIEVSLGTSNSILTRIEEGGLDLAVINFASNRADPPGELLRIVPSVWAGARAGRAHSRDPLPLALYSDGCIWRDDALEQLASTGRPYRIAYESAQGMTQKAAVEADLAVAPVPLSFVSANMEVLKTAQGFKALPSFEIRLVRGNEPAVATEVIAAFLRSELKSA